jgi:hypothetical protein
MGAYTNHRAPNCIQKYNKSRLDLVEGVKELFINQARGKYLYLTNFQVYNESRLDLVEGGRELFITQACSGEYLCKVISSTRPMCRCITRAGWTWLRGAGS